MRIEHSLASTVVWNVNWVVFFNRYTHENSAGEKKTRQRSDLVQSNQSSWRILSVTELWSDQIFRLNLRPNQSLFLCLVQRFSAILSTFPNLRTNHRRNRMVPFFMLYLNQINAFILRSLSHSHLFISLNLLQQIKLIALNISNINFICKVCHWIAFYKRDMDLIMVNWIFKFDR